MSIQVIPPLRFSEHGAAALLLLGNERLGCREGRKKGRLHVLGVLGRGQQTFGRGHRGPAAGHLSSRGAAAASGGVATRGAGGAAARATLGGESRGSLACNRILAEIGTRLLLLLLAHEEQDHNQDESTTAGRDGNGVYVRVCEE